MLYAFILGKNPTLSIAEIVSVLKRDRFVFVITSISTKTLIIKIDKEIENVQNFLDKLGGTVKIARVFGTSKESEIAGPMIGYISNSFKGSKFAYGISFYGIKNKNIGFEIKKYLKTIGINSRFVLGKEESLSAPEIKNNGIIEKGADFVVIRNGKDIYVGKTIAIQDYESYSHRDYDRPRRNAKSGMLPPKIAQIMINLIPLKSNQAKSCKPIIYDPFCGNGTILQEAALMGFEILGSDLSRDRIYDTQQNLCWLKKEYNLDINTKELLFQSDALKLKKEDFPKTPDAIVSEVYLGPPLTERVTEKEIFVITKELEDEYLSFLKNIHLINISYLVLALPFYILRKKHYHLNVIDEAKKIGYNSLSPIQNLDFDLNLLPEYNGKINSIIYSRPEQIVGREIIVFERK
ncbi:MAG TPA: hypothetical protein P5096_00600 [Patescibacteria group bacterium]|nr:hypothetical protein [Patescibacteria group bacterium]